MFESWPGQHSLHNNGTSFAIEGSAPQERDLPAIDRSRSHHQSFNQSGVGEARSHQENFESGRVCLDLVEPAYGGNLQLVITNAGGGGVTLRLEDGQRYSHDRGELTSKNDSEAADEYNSEDQLQEDGEANSAATRARTIKKGGRAAFAVAAAFTVWASTILAYGISPSITASAATAIGAGERGARDAESEAQLEGQLQATAWKYSASAAGSSGASQARACSMGKEGWRTGSMTGSRTGHRSGFAWSDGPSSQLCLQATGSGQEVYFAINPSSFDCQNIDGCQVEIKFDDGKKQALTAVTSPSGSTDTLVLSDQQSSALIAEMKQSRRVEIQAKTSDHGEQDFTFNVSGLDWNRSAD